MIPRILVPFSRSAAEGIGVVAGARKSTRLDSRTLVPAEMPPAPLQTKSEIPSHVPLEVLGERLLVPRDLPPAELRVSGAAGKRFPPTTLDARIAIPPDARPPELSPKRAAIAEALRDLLEPDLLTTGEVHFLPERVQRIALNWAWSSAAGSVILHILLLSVLVALPRLIPAHQPTEQEIESAHRSLGLVYLPPPSVLARELPQAAPPPPTSRIRIDPRVFQKVAPPDVEASPTPGPDSTPTPRLAERESHSEAKPAEETRNQPGKQMAKLEPPPKPPGDAPSGLSLTPRSPGRIMEDTMRGAISKGTGGGSGEFGDQLPAGPGGSGGGGQGYVGGTVQILTPTEGVDFTNYVARMLASVRRNWYAVIPESARMGERGMVVLDFSVRRDGSVPSSQPDLMRSSSREPLDRAAISAIRASSPFEPLPAAFSGPEVRFRFIFLYNMRLDQQ